jgi:GWxTD domain-containing protein
MAEQPMKRFRSSLVLAFLLLAALPATAELVKYKDWNKSPEYMYLTTDDDKSAWKKVTTDEQAEKFVALFWARRNPDLKNPANEFRQIFEARVAKADELFALGKKRGALTERGKLFILIGKPKSLGQSAESSASQPFASSTGGFITTAGAPTVKYQFLYEQPQLPAWSDVQTLDAKFQVDTSINSEHLIDMGPVKHLENMAVAKAIVHPELKEAPVYKTRQEADAEAKVAGEAAAEAAKGPVLSPEVRKALEDALAAGSQDGLTLFPLDYANGATRLMVQLFVPAAKAIAPDLKLALLARTKDGKDAVRKEEPAALEKTKGDFFADRALTVPAGEYDVAVGLFDAAGAPAVVSRGSVKVVDFPAGFSSSPLVLAYNDYESPGSKPDDPFLFFQRKFVGKGNLKLDPKTDGLAWVIRLYNPTIDAQRKITLKKVVTVVTKSGQKIDVPQGPPEPIVVPDMKVPDQKGTVLDIAGGIVDSDLKSYFPAEATVKVVFTDMASTTEPKASVEVSAPFSIDMPPPAPKKK